MSNTGAFTVVGVLAIAFAGLPDDASAQDEAAGDERVEYVSTADVTELMRDDLVALAGAEARVYEVEFPAGWVGDWHYHTGDVFVYVMEGEFIVDLKRRDRVTVGPGEVYHEAVNQVMQARAGSTIRPTRALLFQVGERDEPLMIRADPASDS